MLSASRDTSKRSRAWRTGSTGSSRTSSPSSEDRSGDRAPFQFKLMAGLPEPTVDRVHERAHSLRILNSNNRTARPVRSVGSTRHGRAHMKVAIIGSGNVGKALASSAVKAGHDVTITATTYDKAVEAAKATGCRAGTSNVESVKDADLVIIAVPYDKLGEVFRGLGDAVDGKVVIDATN